MIFNKKWNYLNLIFLFCSIELALIYLKQAPLDYNFYVFANQVFFDILGSKTSFRAILKIFE